MSDSTSDMIISRTGNKINWNYEVVRRLYLEEKISTKVLATKAGVHLVTMQKYLRDSGLAEIRKKNRIEVNSRFNTPSTKLTEYQIANLNSRIITCPVCGKQFLPAPMHIYKDKRGRLTCNYTCAKKGGWKG